MGEVKSTRELEDHMEEVGRQWNEISQGTLGIRRACNKCWRNEGDHEDMSMDEGCQLPKLSSSLYFDGLVTSIGALERVAIVYEKGLGMGILLIKWNPT